VDKALIAAGLETSNELNISDERLFENLLVLWTHYGRQPRRSELGVPPSIISQSPYRRRFKSWSAALDEFVRYMEDSEQPGEPPAQRPPVALAPISIGPIAGGVILVVWTERDERTIRIISARFATKREVALYRAHVERLQ
jgi:hypothetical protein